MAVEKRRNRSGWWAGGAVAALLAGSAFFEWWSYGTPQRPVEINNLTPQAGGIALSETTPVAGSNGEPATPIATVCIPDNTVIALGAVRMYADADVSTLVLNAYEDGVQFTVEQPSGDYGAYPVEHNGKSWCRLRADDGLVGWVDVMKIQ